MKASSANRQVGECLGRQHKCMGGCACRDPADVGEIEQRNQQVSPARPAAKRGCACPTRSSPSFVS